MNKLTQTLVAIVVVLSMLSAACVVTGNVSTDTEPEKTVEVLEPTLEVVSPPRACT